MTREEYLLLMVMEECDELSQRASKALRFGIAQVQPGQTFDNRDRMISEFADLVAAMDMVGISLKEVTAQAVVNKIDKVERYLAFSMGTAPHP